MTSSEFSGHPPLTVGSLYGSRSFHVDKDGSLSAVTWKYKWKNGENVAECINTMRHDNVYTTMMSAVLETYKPPEHNIAQCPSHGFYAYTEGSNDFGGFYDRISGVIEGYGVTHVGTRGFRAEKAKIVGLVIPDSPKGLRAQWKGFIDNHGFKAKMLAFVVYMIVMNTGIQLISLNSVVGYLTGVPLIILSLYILWTGIMTGSSDYYKKPNFSRYKMTNKAMYEKIKANYSDAKTFNTYEEMIKYFNIGTEKAYG